jgi:hypothetical protein
MAETPTGERMFTCSECGGDVVAKTGPGRTMEYRRGCPPMPVPEDFSIPTCAACGDTYVAVDAESRLTELLEASFLAWQKEHLRAVVGHITTAHNATAAQVANVAGVTRQHLQAVVDGDMLVTVTLQRLLECYATVPQTFTLHSLREDADESASPKPAPAANETAPPSPTAVNLSVAVKRLSKEIRKAIAKTGFARPNGGLVDGGAVVLAQIFGTLAAEACRSLGGDVALFLATMQVQWEESGDKGPDATKPPNLVLLR